MFEVVSLHVYPVKSMGGLLVSSFRMTDRGPEHDRRFMLVDGDRRFLSQRECPSMALFRTSMAEGRLEVRHASDPSGGVSVPLRPATGEELRVQVWDDECVAWRVSETADRWFSGILGRECVLVYMPDHSLRPVDPDYAPGGEVTSFSDGYPVLVIGESSLEDLNVRLSVPVSMDRFRPNIVFRGGEPFSEDGFRHIRIGDVDFFGVKPCARCVVTTIDPSTGVAGKEPLATLSTYRSRGGKVNFGMNLLHRGEGVVRVGDGMHQMEMGG
jgi:uncharacterized protein YcbX